MKIATTLFLFVVVGTYTRQLLFLKRADSHCYYIFIVVIHLSCALVFFFFFYCFFTSPLIWSTIYYKPTYRDYSVTVKFLAESTGLLHQLCVAYIYTCVRVANCNFLYRYSVLCSARGNNSNLRARLLGMIISNFRSNIALGTVSALLACCCL